MNNTFAIAMKETRSYFATPTAYVVGAMFLIYTGIVFVLGVTGQSPEATVRTYITPASFFLIFLSPLLTMRLLAEEQKLGTLELLLTAPVRDWEVVMGKYVAAFIMLTVTIALSLYYVILLYWFGDPDTGPLLSSYLGLFLHGAAALAIGLMASSLSANQIVAGVVGIGTLLILSFIDAVADRFTGIAADVLANISMGAHFEDFTRGVIDTSNIVYYISLTAVFLFVTVRILETRRWR